MNRKNWEKIPQIRKLVERYALEVSRFSNLTKDMKKPGIVSIKLVGAVLGLSLIHISEPTRPY